VDIPCGRPPVLVSVSPFAFCPAHCVAGCATGLLRAEEDDDAHALAHAGLKCKAGAAGARGVNAGLQLPC